MKREKLSDKIWALFSKKASKVTDNIVEKTHLKEKGQKIVDYAEKDRKRMLSIIVIFLTLCTIVSITRAVVLSTKKNAFKEPKMMLDTIVRHMPRNQFDELEGRYIEYQEAKKLQGEIETLLAKDTLTSQDSARLISIYNIIVEGEYE